MITLSPIDLILRVSAATVGAGEVGGPNAGPYVERVQRRTGNRKGDAWCSSVVADWGAIAFDAAWPCPLTGSVMTLCEWAEHQGVRYVPGAVGKGVPRVGDLHAIYFPSLKRWAHTGLITAIDANNPLHVTVRDGNTTDPKIHNPSNDDREGWLVANKVRILSAADRLIRWSELLP